MRRLPLLVAFAVAPGFASAQAEDKAPADGLRLKMSEIELGASRETLSGGRPDWTGLSVEGAHRFAPRQALYGGWRETKRFDLRDTELWAGYSHPLGRDWTVLVEASASDEHNVLPKSSVFGQLSRALPAGWGINLGWRHSEYTRVGVDILVAGAERYWGNWRGAYTLYAGRPEGATTGVAHRFALNYYYGEGSTLGVSATAGREVDNVGPPTGILTTEVRNLTFTGRHWMSRDWAFSWDLVAHEQGTLYRRQGFRLGLRYRF